MHLQVCKIIFITALELYILVATILFIINISGECLYVIYSSNTYIIGTGYEPNHNSSCCVFHHTVSSFLSHIHLQIIQFLLTMYICVI